MWASARLGTRSPDLPCAVSVPNLMTDRDAGLARGAFRLNVRRLMYQSLIWRFVPAQGCALARPKRTRKGPPAWSRRAFVSFAPVGLGTITFYPSRITPRLMIDPKWRKQTFARACQAPGLSGVPGKPNHASQAREPESCDGEQHEHQEASLSQRSRDWCSRSANALTSTGASKASPRSPNRAHTTEPSTSRSSAQITTCLPTDGRSWPRIFAPVGATSATTMGLEPSSEIAEPAAETERRTALRRPPGTSARLPKHDIATLPRCQILAGSILARCR